MNKWLERHREKIIHGLLISVLALLVILVMRGSMSKEIARVRKDNDALTAVVEARGEALERERAAAKELALAREEDKAEAAKLASANEELSARRSIVSTSQT